MSKSFETREAAQHELDSNFLPYTRAINKHCPLTNNKCRSDCAAYIQPYVHILGGTAKGYTISHGHCGSPLITGSIIVENTY